MTITDSSASRLGDMLQSGPVAAPLLGDARASRHAPTSTSLVDRTTAANDVLDPPSTGPVNPSQHADHPISPAHDVLPLDNILDPAPHHNSAAGDHHNAPANDDAKPAHADVLKIDNAAKPSGHVNANPNDAASSDATVPASDGATIHQAQTTPPSTGALVEDGTKAILLATDESPNRIGPHASAADFALSAGPGHVHSSAHATAAFSPGVIGARDQLASAIATATQEAAAMTTLPPPQMTGAGIPTLGGDMHALPKHAA
ncbi:hypothetical protein XI08_39355 [Bradyrhizobium sp. CCBAU 11361]|nr:hypothetical protein [Bradyrhizobium sp. CCBAU 11361]